MAVAGDKSGYLQNGPARQQAQQAFIGRSEAFQSILRTIDTVACRQCAVVLLGETGTGKEIVARQIHIRSTRSESVFVPVDCTSLSGQLFESQLFGHVRGAFTGAVSDTLGFFRSADGGTIFLDEIGELGQDLQAKLLRVLQEGRVVPLGSTRWHAVDVRVVCATNQDLRKMVMEGKFRQDLYFRLNVVQLELPPLRQRRDDILVLARHFLGRQAELYGEPPKRLSPAVEKILTDYTWPGNIRELANVMEHAYILSEADEIQPQSLSADILTGGLLNSEQQGFPTMDKVNEKLVVRALQAANGKKMVAAKLLNIDHRRLARMISKYHLQPTWK